MTKTKIQKFDIVTFWNVTKHHKISHDFKCLVHNYVYLLRLDFTLNASKGIDVASIPISKSITLRSLGHPARALDLVPILCLVNSNKKDYSLTYRTWLKSRHRQSVHRVTATHCYALQHTATHCNTLQRITTVLLQNLTSAWLKSRHYQRVYRMTATHCNALQRTATHCNALQRTATPALQLCYYIIGLVQYVSSHTRLTSRRRKRSGTVSWVPSH